MPLLVLSIEGEPRVQVVRLDDVSPGRDALYAAAVARNLPETAKLRYVAVDVTSVAEYGPNDVAAMLRGDDDWVTDLPQTWEEADPFGS